MLSGKKVLVTGATGQIARPIAERLAADNEVWAAARFLRYTDARAALEGLGIRTIPWDLASGDNSMLPDDFTHVLHAAFLIGADDHHTAVEVNGECTGLLMQHCRNAEAFVFVSGAVVYKPLTPDHLHKEKDPFGGVATYAPDYPSGKFAGEVAARTACRMLNLPTTIARMNIGYGVTGHGGMPVMCYELMRAGQPIPLPIGHENYGSPIHQDDIAEQGSGPLFDIASVPATIVNWGGNDVVTQREYCDYIGSITGLTPQYAEADEGMVFEAYASDTTLRDQLIGRCKVGWKEGIRQVLEAKYPEAFATPLLRS